MNFSSACISERHVKEGDSSLSGVFLAFFCKSYRNCETQKAILVSRIGDTTEFQDVHRTKGKTRSLNIWLTARLLWARDSPLQRDQQPLSFFSISSTWGMCSSLDTNPNRSKNIAFLAHSWHRSTPAPPLRSPNIQQAGPLSRTQTLIAKPESRFKTNLLPPDESCPRPAFRLALVFLFPPVFVAVFYLRAPYRRYIREPTRSP